MSPLEAAVLLASAFAAGAINAVAGGGSLVSFPALVGVGYEPKTANVTNSVALLPGYLGGSFGYRGELSLQRAAVRALTPISVAGAIAGSAILLLTPESAFEAIVPFLILFACALMALQDRLSSFAMAHRLVERGRVTLLLQAATFILAAYGAYFGAGLGILTLAVLGILFPDDIQRSNALKGLLSLLINFVAVVLFALFGPVEWPAAAVMALGALSGGYIGVGIARRLGKSYLRLAVISYGLLVAIIILVR